MTVSTALDEGGVRYSRRRGGDAQKGTVEVQYSRRKQQKDLVNTSIPLVTALPKKSPVWHLIAILFVIALIRADAQFAAVVTASFVSLMTLAQWAALFILRHQSSLSGKVISPIWMLRLIRRITFCGAVGYTLMA